MKHLALMIAAAMMVLPSCAQNRKSNEMKTLVAYFSATGTTEAVAKDLAEVTGATLYEIKPEVKYTAADLDWRNKESRSTIEMQDKNSRPAIMWRYKGQKHIQKMQYAFWALYPLVKLFGGWNTMSEVGRAMIAVSKSGYNRHEIEVKDISILAKHNR